MEYCYNISQEKVIQNDHCRDSPFRIFDHSTSSDVYSSKLNTSGIDSGTTHTSKEDATNSFFISAEDFSKSTIINNNSTSILHIGNSDTIENYENKINATWPNTNLVTDNSLPIGVTHALDDSCRQEEGRHIKRPMNAFMVWSQSERKIIANEYPKMHNSDISKILGTRWKELSAEDKKPYVKMAKALQHKHNVEHPNYKYKPRRKVKKAQLPVSSTITHHIEKYLCGYNPTFDNPNSIHPFRRPNPEIFNPKQIIYSSDVTRIPCVPNILKLPTFEPINPYKPQTFAYRNPQYSQIPINTTYGLPPNLDRAILQASAMNGIDIQNGITIVPLYPMMGQNQVPYITQQYIAAHNQEIPHMEPNGSVSNNDSNNPKKFKDSDFNHHVKREKYFDESISINEEAIKSPNLCQNVYGNQPQSSNSSHEDCISKNNQQNFPIGIVNYSDYGAFCYNGSLNSSEKE